MFPPTGATQKGNGITIHLEISENMYLLWILATRSYNILKLTIYVLYIITYIIHSLLFS